MYKLSPKWELYAKLRDIAVPNCLRGCGQFRWNVEKMLDLDTYSYTYFFRKKCKGGNGCAVNETYKRKNEIEAMMQIVKKEDGESILKSMPFWLKLKYYYVRYWRKDA